MRRLQPLTRRGPPDCGQRREAAGAVAEGLIRLCPRSQSFTAFPSIVPIGTEKIAMLCPWLECWQPKI
jgi:hypothetical protein